MEAPVRARAAPVLYGAAFGRAALFYGGATVLTGAIAVAAVLSPQGIELLVGLALVAALGTLMWTRPHAIAPLVVIGFAVQPDLKFFLSSAFGPAKDVIAVGAILVLIVRCTDRSWRREVNCDPWIVAGIIAVLALYVINVNGSHDADWRSAARPVIEAFGLFLVGYALLRYDRAWQVCIGAMLIMGIIEAVAGLTEQVVGQPFLADTLGFPYNVVLTTVNGLPRSFGTQLDPFNYAAMIALAVPFALFTVRGRSRTWLLVALLAAGLAAGLLRTSAIVAVALVLLALIHRRRAASAGFLVAASVLAVAAYVVQSSTSSRGASTAVTLNGRTAEWARVEHPQILLAGAGVGNLGSGASRSSQGAIVNVPKQGSADQAAATEFTAASTSIDSSYLALVADVGLPGLLLVLALFVRIIVVALRATRLGTRTGPALLGLVIVVLIDGATRSSLTQFPFGDIALLAIGITLAAAERDIADVSHQARHPEDRFIGYDWATRSS